MSRGRSDVASAGSTPGRHRTARSPSGFMNSQPGSVPTPSMTRLIGEEPGPERDSLLADCM